MNRRLETKALQEENIWKKTLAMIFLDLTPKAKAKNHYHNNPKNYPQEQQQHKKQKQITESNGNYQQ